ncbi:transposase [Sphingobium sp. ZW T5_29]|uniref:transposase n=1 Tax=Sphingobium sp. ZW T5_29 TaxID=3378077 RepID=UPI003854FC4B
MENLKCGRDFAAWLGLVPRQFSSAAKSGLGAYRGLGRPISQAADYRCQVALELARS